MNCFLELMLFIFLLSFTSGQVTVQFRDRYFYVRERGQFDIVILKFGQLLGDLTVIVSIEQDDQQDFVGQTQVATFTSSANQVSATFTVRDDNIPEDEETFYFRLSVVGNRATATQPFIATVVIDPSDDAFGEFSFTDLGPIIVIEEKVTTIVDLFIDRKKGLFQKINVQYEVEGLTNEAIAGSDIGPIRGDVTFSADQQQSRIQLQVRSDQIPENTERFMVKLTGTDNTRAKIDRGQIEVRILANDAPISFEKNEYRYEEGIGSKTYHIVLLRGIQNGNSIPMGPIDTEATVDIVLVSNTAILRKDFDGKSQKITFNPGVMRTNFTFTILDDLEPEIEETFRVQIGTLKGDVVWGNPIEAIIKISANDKPNGAISFQSIDAANSLVVRVNEDTFTVAIFPVVRNGGSFGAVAVSWELVSFGDSNDLVTSDVGPMEGTVTFADGQRDGSEIRLIIVQDIIPEVAEKFLIRLKPETLAGNAKVEGITVAELIIEDSDNVYGIVEFGPDNTHLIPTTFGRRYLQFQLNRIGGRKEDLVVNITVAFNDVDSILTIDDMLLENEVSVIMKAGEDPVIVELSLLTTAFLQLGGSFVATLTDVRLQTVPEFGVYNSPSLGTRKSVTLEIKSEEANGKIGFFNMTNEVVSEPTIGTLEIPLTVSREGRSGNALVRWSIKGVGESEPHVTSEDVIALSGIVTIPSGQSSAELIVRIRPDNIPENDETMAVTLVSVEPSGTQRLHVATRSINITILENDNPGGVFQFSAEMKSAYLVGEGEESIEVVVERLGGNLMLREVQYVIEPEGINEFYGAVNVLRFLPGQTRKTATVIAISDNVPELGETYTMRLSSYGETEATIGQRDSILVTITANDMPYGVLQFTRNPMVEYIRESRGANIYNASLTVERLRGSFGTVTVAWTLVPNDGDDLKPTFGTITFAPGQAAIDIDIASIDDDIAEEDETIRVKLSSPTGGAELGTPDVATIIIRSNDNPVEFTTNEVYTDEPASLVFTVVRKGNLAEAATVRYRTLDGAATALDKDFNQIIAKEILFSPGQATFNFTVSILDDDLPEGNETFILQLYDLEGDLLLTDRSTATIIIMDNDDAYGVFKFEEPYGRNAEEGSTVYLDISRDKGREGVIEVFWNIRSIATGKFLTDGDQFEKTRGSVVFQSQERKQPLSILPLADNIPETNLQYTIELVDTKVLTGRTDTANLARLDNFGTSIILLVVASDDPNGRFAFPATSRELQIAEDFEPGKESTTRTTVSVERRQGTLGKVKLVWEIYSDSVGGNFPDVIDLMFVGNQPDTMQPIPSKQRPQTGTLVLLFSQAEDNYVTLSDMYKPDVSKFTNGLTLSCWVQPFPNTDGYIISKTSVSGVRHYYSLKLKTSVTSTDITLKVSTSVLNNQEVKAQSDINIQDGSWHHIIVSISNTTITFYLDGKVIGTGIMFGNALIDQDGPLLVGATSKNRGEERFTGYMQDVRLFKRSLEENEIREIYELPARKEVTPVSGMLTFEENVKSNTFQVRSLQDVEEEGNKVFTVDLLAASGGGAISTSDATATLTVLKSDNANGQFRYKDLCTPTSTSKENVAITCSVERLRGDDGKVYLTWLVRQVLPSGPIDAVDDFVNYTGIITFLPGQRLQTIQFEVKEEMLPEVRETFIVYLEKVESDDGIVGTTDTSGASIDPDGSMSQIVIEETDFPYGLLQFSNNTVPPETNDQMILPVNGEQEINIREEIGIATFIVLRAQGTQGRITAEWRTEDGTAKSEGKTPIDYEGDASSVVLEEGETWTHVNITIFDNEIPEDQKYFYVSLVNPQGGAVIGAGGRLKVTIESSDGAFGIYRFDDRSLSVTADEEGDLGYNSVFLKVLRLGGSIGRANVSWITEGDVKNDLMEKSGELIFVTGQLTAQIEIKIRGDLEPELDEFFRIKLIGTTEGELGDKYKLDSLLQIKANDDPYGVFVITQTYRPIKVEERNSDVTIFIQRLKGTFGSVQVSYSTLLPTKTFPFLPGPLQRAEETDFRTVSKYVRFAEKQEFANFTITIFDDSIPEQDESVFVRLTAVNITEVAQVNLIPNSPRVGADHLSYAQIIITSNDDAGGVLELFPSTVSVAEGSQPQISVRRLGGLFGEVTVQFRAIEGSAKSKVDYEVIRGEVILNSGESNKLLPIEIIDDRIPELQESFSVELLSVNSGGASLGENKQAVINIESSDDPYGLFGFALESQSIEEPENGLPYDIDITVLRLGGTMGIVTLEWQALLDGEPASADIQPSSGSLRFVSGDSSLRIKITILPDDLPEGQEDIILTLSKRGTEEGRLGEKTTFLLSIAPNDNPHGFVQMYSTEYKVQEKADEKIRIERSGGTYGSLRVYYTVGEIDLVSEAIRQGQSVISYYGDGINGKRLDVGNMVDISRAVDPFLACASLCLSIEACVSFQYSGAVNSTSCHWFTSPTNTVASDDNLKVYDKNSEKYKLLQDIRAKTDEDFQLMNEESIIIGDGETSGAITLKLIDDNKPELDERYKMMLTRVEVADSAFATKEKPVLGETKSALITILSNDNANGMFNIYGSPASLGRNVEVEETDKLAVDLVVQREGGSIGDVSVRWSVDKGSATYGHDFIADGAILTFSNGQTRRVITVTILDDPDPEDREEFIVYLSDPQGQSQLGVFNNITVVILENDYVAGLVGLEATSILAAEGDKLTVNIKRSLPAHGTVTVQWTIVGRAGLKASSGFKTSSGTLIFPPGETSKSIILEVLVDDTPETNEEYELKLINVETEGVGTTGAASIDPQFGVSLITIQGSNNPHGIFQIASASLNIRTEENVGQIQILIDRKFGAIGVVRVNYEVLSGSIAQTNPDLLSATFNQDFKIKTNFIDIGNTNASGAIVIDIVNDEAPEIDEVFTVRLTSVSLVGSTAASTPPQLADNGTEAEIIINANDGAKGIMMFGSGSRDIQLDERNIMISLSVKRTAGTFGEVSVFYHAESLQATGSDYKITPQELVFANGENSRNILVEILDDNEPEPDEQFQVILSNPKNNVEINKIFSIATITILANDGASGEVSFDSAQDVILKEPSVGNSVGSKAEIRVIRGPGKYGVVIVPFLITPQSTSGTMDDVSRTNGVLTFQDEQTTAILEVSALPDDNPENDEMFTIELLKPNNDATLGQIKKINLIISSNDAPQGLFEISLSQSGGSSILVEENAQGFISLDIKRTRGFLGRVTIDVVTEQQTAFTANDPRAITLSHFQYVIGLNVSSWYSYEVKDVTYIIMLTSLKSDQQLRSLLLDATRFEVGQSIVWRWQGEMVYFQTLETNNAVAVTSFENNDITYVAIANGGREGARETLSSLYRVNDDGKLEWIQGFSTKGASDVEYFTYNNQKLLIFTNSLDDASSSMQTADVYVWDNTNLRFNTNPIQSVATMYARAAATTTFDGNLFLFIANYYDSVQDFHETRSVVFRMSSDIRFSKPQRINTMGAIDGIFIDTGNLLLLVVGNNRQNTVSSPQTSVIYRWDSSTLSFLLHQDIETRRVEKISSVRDVDGTVFLIFANDIGNSEIFIWNSLNNQFSSVWKGDASAYLYPIIIQQDPTPLTLLASVPVIQQSKATVFEMSRISETSDFVPRKVTLIFEENQSLLHATAVVLQDNDPEDTETFAVKLANPKGGAEIGSQSSVIISILSNDNAHGIIEFSDESLLKRVVELPDRDSTVQFTLVRNPGFHGQVVVRWSTSGDHDGQNDVAPLSGMVTFADGVSIATLSITIRDDSISEFDEETIIKLEEVIQGGTNLPARGAKIGAKNEATLVVMANDSPHGVVSWETDLISIEEPQNTDIVITVAMIREQGTTGSIRISYLTSLAVALDARNQAISGEDYDSSQGEVIFTDGVTRATISITIKQDEIPEAEERFLINITNAELFGAGVNLGSKPSIKIPGNVMEIRIPENDNARGVVQFNETLNIEGRVDKEELFNKNNTFRLRLMRTVGTVGAVTVTWEADPIEANSLDYHPTTGTVRFEDGEAEGFLEMTILDDAETESIETFDVKLLNINGGAIIGERKTVRVAILKNDSPNGLFLFKQTKIEVKESKNNQDPEGQARITVLRQQGVQGLVNIQWRLNAEAAADFLEPTQGTVQFSQGETEKIITLQTRPDNVLEGREEFTVSLISADNGADVSSTLGDATVVILPDTGSSGTISILPDYKTVYIGETGQFSGYNGQTEIVLTRGGGIFGEVMVTWSISPRDSQAFLQQEGSVRFGNLQKQATIIVQSKDDTKPELRSIYTLQINSVVGGAVISKEPSATSSNIIYVASDYPHGVFEFSLPEISTVEEDTGVVSIPVVRKNGDSGQVQVSYSTSSGTATENIDFFSTSGTLLFEQGVRSQNIDVNIRPDSDPEGPETFYVNITSIELLQPTSNDYSIIQGGLQLDMEPIIGVLDIKTIIIDKNDNSEGTIEFSQEALQFKVKEETRIARIPLTRLGGNFGRVSVSYRTQNMTALIGQDYVASSGEVYFDDGMQSNTINITIIDDDEMEFDETFRVVLTGTGGGAKLGNNKESVVTILKSDYPNGVFGFTGDPVIIMDNPVRLRKQTFAIERKGGLLGQQQVFWRIMGPNNPNIPLEDSTDISLDQNNAESASGNLIWQDGESGVKEFVLDVKPYSNWEIEKTFIIQTYRIDGNPDSVGDGEISPDRGSVTLTIKKHGDPNGIIRFGPEAQIARNEDEPTIDVRKLFFPVARRDQTGMVGTIKINWKVEGPIDSGADVRPLNGSLLLADNQRTGSIVLDILSDDVPELTEQFTLKLVSVEGGAELDNVFTSSVFRIRYNDNPHGLFQLLPESQAIMVDPADLSRQLVLNFTRDAGTFGSVVLTYTVKYDQPQSNVGLSKNTGTLTFSEGTKWMTEKVDILGNGFIDLGSTFTLSLLEVRFLGSSVTIEPKLVPGKSQVKITVPEEAANTKIGFTQLEVSVDEETNIVELELMREGTYGALTIDWEGGYPQDRLPSATTNGRITPSRGILSIPHATKTKSFSVQVNARLGIVETFVIRLPRPPASSINGGGQLMAGKTETKIEPSGVIRFARSSTAPDVSELEGKVTLTVERLYGSEGKLEIVYDTQDNTAIKDVDFSPPDSKILIMDPGVISLQFDIEIIQDNEPETVENFYVNLTRVIRFPTSPNKRISPRLSSLYSDSVVTIKESNDPYGILYIRPLSSTVTETFRKLTLRVERSGGLYGSVSVRVRTVGGGESWTSLIVARPGVSNNTIADILGNRDQKTAATAGLDYQIIDQTLTFLQDEKSKEFELTILDDPISEPAETILVYLTQPVGGATIATGEDDGGRTGFSIITIQGSDLSNGVIGFSQSSSIVTANEDTQPRINLELFRLYSYFGSVQVTWRAKRSLLSTEEQDAKLADTLVSTAGTVICPPTERCTFFVDLKEDDIPEEAEEFLVVLTGVGNDAKLNNQSLVARINVQSSDDVRGLIQFTPSSRTVIVSDEDSSVTLNVERSKGQRYLVTVDYETRQINNQITESGVVISPALDGQDFSGETGTLQFLQDSQELGLVNLRLTPVLSSSNPLPKQFSVYLRSSTNRSRLHPDYSTANIIIVSKDEVFIWQAVTGRQDGPLKDTDILTLLGRLDKVAQDDVSEDAIKLIEKALREILDEGARRKLPPQVATSLLNLFCKLLDPSKDDATKGRHSLAKYFEEFAYTFVTNSSCPALGLVTYQCTHAKISGGRWTRDKIQNYEYKAQRQDEFQIPDGFLEPTSSVEQKCEDFHIIEYNSAQWFQTDSTDELLSSRIMAFGIKGKKSAEVDSPFTFRIHTPDRRIATKRAKCVYYDEGSLKWTGSDKLCKVTNNLDLAIDSFVDCSCNHMTSYAVLGKTYEAGIVGYTIWFFIACFICMICLAIVILSHQVCSVHPMFAASLLMHMCFAAMATQICIVVAAYLSPTDILVANIDNNNYRCIVMGLFLHYFFLCQFSWIMTQSVNIWKILVLNDEHTDRKYILFFLLGWGLPMILIAIFYAVTYNVYKYRYDLPVDFIYGDINNNGEMCFITNAYAGLGGVIVPILIMLVVVAVVFIKAFQLTPQWQSYDDIYRGRYNLSEVRIMLAFWIVIILTWLWGGLHMVYGQLWMLILFCIFNIIQGLMALVLYAILRNPCITCCGRSRKSQYGSSHFASVSPQFHNYGYQGDEYNTPPVKGSKANLLNEDWDRDSIGPKSEMTVKRALPTQVYINPPLAMISPPSHHHDMDDKDFEDLLHALKTGGSVTPSELSRSLDDSTSTLSVRLDNFETKRINIADTHL